MDKDYLIDGDTNLIEQEDSLNLAQDLGAGIVTKYKAIDADPKIVLKHPNVATLKSLAIGGHVKPIKLVKVNDLTTPKGIEETAGRILSFNSDIYVEGKITKVNGYC